MATISKSFTFCLKLLIRSYRAVSLLLGPCCRFEPSCSAYALEAIDQHGGYHGLMMTIRRLLCCHPWHPGGFDPVPKNEKFPGTKLREIK